MSNDKSKDESNDEVSEEIVIEMKNLFYQEINSLVVKKNSVMIEIISKYNELIREVEHAKQKEKKNPTDIRRVKRYNLLNACGINF